MIERGFGYGLGGGHLLEKAHTSFEIFHPTRHIPIIVFSFLWQQLFLFYELIQHNQNRSDFDEKGWLSLVHDWLGRLIAFRCALVPTKIETAKILQRINCNACVFN